MRARSIRPTARALDAALGTPWAIQPEALENLLSIAGRQHEVTPEALEAYRAEAAERGERLEQRGEVAILRAHGPFFRRANLFTDLSGASSYEVMRLDFQAALDDPKVRAILLDVDSPGGEVTGCGELAKAIFAARAVKSVVAYVGGTAASAAYWLASAASEVVLDDSAMVGSIGAVIGFRDTRGREEASGVRTFEFVSSQSPLKRAEPDTKEGAGEYQRLADETAAVFIDAVAKHRGRTTATVVEKFGGGGLLIGAKAVAAGMADRIGTFEETLARLGRSGSGSRTPAPSGSVAEAVAEDRARYSAIMALPEAEGREPLARQLHEADLSVEAARATLALAPLPVPPQVAGPSEAEIRAYEAARSGSAAWEASPAARELPSRLPGIGLGGQPKFGVSRPSLADLVREQNARARGEKPPK